MANFSSDSSVFQAFQGISLPGEAKASLFIGPRESLHNETGLQEYGVTHIISVVDEARAFRLSSAFTRLMFDITDDLSCNLLDKWPECCDFVDRARREGGATLIHCDTGSSRSGATLIACLMYLSKQSAGECLAIAQRARSVIAPNEGFWAQLLAWERKCCGGVSVAGEGYMHEIRPRLWLGAIEATQDWENLQKHGITHVMTCGRALDSVLPQGIDRVCSLGIDDLDEVDIMEHLPTTSDTIANVLCAHPANRILVHCASGRSRSASVVIAFLMREENIDYATAVKVVQLIRSVVQPNSGFTHQLAWYGKNGCPADLCDKSTGKRYSDLPEFIKLLRKYTERDVISLVNEAGAGDPDCRDVKALQRALSALDRLQNALPADDKARDAKKAQSRRINIALDDV